MSEAQLTNDHGVFSYSSRNKIARITFERPKKYNTLTYEVISEMQRVLKLIANDQSVNVLVIASRGKSFCTGHDMKEMNAKRDEKFYQDLLFECSKNRIFVGVFSASTTFSKNFAHPEGYLSKKSH